MPLKYLSVKRILCLLLLMPALAAMSVFAQPSGGPYGPVEKSYSVPKSGNVIYVAPNGKASADGSSVDKPTTLEAAISRVVTGDAVILRGGIYRTGNLELNQGITLQPYADEKPVLKGTEVATAWKSAGEGVWQTSWEKLFPSKPMFWWRREREEARTPMHRFNNDLVFIDGRFLQSAGSVKELTADNYYIDYDKKRVYIGTDPKGHTVEITAHDTAITRTTAKVHGKDADKKGPQILGITFTQYAWTALAIEGKRHFTHLDEPVDEPIGPADPATYGKEVVGTLLENVTISFCGRVAGYFRGDGLVIRNSLFSDTSTEAIYVIGSSDVLLERNIVTRNNIENISGYFASAVKIINQTHRVVVRDNLLLDHANSNGVWYDVGNRDGVFINNYVEGANVAFMFEISQGVTVTGNVFNSNQLGMWILNSADSYVYNNTFVNSPARISRTERSAQGDHFDWHPATGPGVEERFGHVFEKNLMVADGFDTGALLRIEQWPKVCTKLPDSPMAAVDGNVYVRPHNEYSAAAAPLVNWIDRKAENCEVGYIDLAAFQQGAGYDKHGLQLDGSARSLFKASDLRNFGLREALPIDKSVSIPADVTKLLGWSKKSAQRTVGAYPAK
nr:right-handed parallel beta-helix repeat-containing protein [Teredinibacter turnerae]